MEHTHHVLKNELAAAALPSGKFGANAAWFRCNMLTYNLLTALKRLSGAAQHALLVGVRHRIVSLAPAWPEIKGSPPSLTTAKACYINLNVFVRQHSTHHPNRLALNLMATAISS